MFGIGNAVKEMQKGCRVRRAGWNGKGMFLELVMDGRLPDDRIMEPYVVMYTAQGTLIPWLCSQSDLLAFDWELVT